MIKRNFTSVADLLDGMGHTKTATALRSINNMPEHLLKALSGLYVAVNDQGTIISAYPLLSHVEMDLKASGVPKKEWNIFRIPTFEDASRQADPSTAKEGK